MSKLEDLAKELGISVADLEKAAERAADREKKDAIAKRPDSALAEPKPDSRWNDADAAEQWLEEEADLIDGVHGFGGQSAGGIFGDAPIATSVYDPQSVQRAEQRATGRMQVKTIELLASMQRQLEENNAEMRRLRAAEEERKQLPGRRGRRR